MNISPPYLLKMLGTLTPPLTHPNLLTSSRYLTTSLCLRKKFALATFLALLKILGTMIPPIYTSKATFYFTTIYNSNRSPFLLSLPPPDFTYRTSGEGLHELHNNSSSGAPKANDDSSALANVEGSWVNISDADGNKPTDNLYGKTVSDGCGDSNGKLTIGESMGTAAGAHNWNSKEKSSESKAAWNMSGEKETGEGGAAGEYHACEELSVHGSCGNACYTCAEADHFARKCTLGADCGCSGHHSGGNSTIPYVV